LPAFVSVEGRMLPRAAGSAVVGVTLLPPAGALRTIRMGGSAIPTAIDPHEQSRPTPKAPALGADRYGRLGWRPGRWPASSTRGRWPSGWHSGECAAAVLQGWASHPGHCVCALGAIASRTSLSRQSRGDQTAKFEFPSGGRRPSRRSAESTPERSTIRDREWLAKPLESRAVNESCMLPTTADMSRT
jgi:hypothetical protein